MNKKLNCLILFLAFCLCSGFKSPTQWGETVPGVVTRGVTTNKVIALTFDACGTTKRSCGYDKQLIDYLIANKIPATLFISGLWLDANPKLVKELAAIPFFEIENHGLRHRPASVNGASAYGIKGTNSVDALLEEVISNNEKLASVTGRAPKFYRSGTNYYDDVAVAIIKKNNLTPLGYNVLGDAGATYTKDQVKAALLSASPGDIIICHMNHPESGTAEGVIQAIPILKKRGYRFVVLRDLF